MIFIKMYIIKDERSLQLSKEYTKLLKMLQNHSQNPWEALESELHHAIGLIMSLGDWAFIPSAQSLLVCGLPSLLVIEGNVSGKAASVWEQFSGEVVIVRCYGSRGMYAPVHVLWFTSCFP